jgi:hypothetical protein
MVTAAGTDAHVKIAFIDGLGDKGDRYLEAAPAVKLAVFEISEILTLTPLCGELHPASALGAIA